MMQKVLGEIYNIKKLYVSLTGVGNMFGSLVKIRNDFIKVGYYKIYVTQNKLVLSSQCKREA